MATNDEGLFESVKTMHPEHIQVRATEFSTQTIESLVVELVPASDIHWKEKLAALFFGLSSREQLEAAGKNIVAKQVIALLDVSHKYEAKHQWKLSPLFVGMTHHTFLNLLSIVNQNQLEILQHEALSEPLQHHLTILLHDAVKQNDDTVEQLQNLAITIKSLNPQKTPSQDLLNCILQIDDAHDHIERWLIIVNRGISLAWNTIREDLVESYTQAKDQLIRTKNQIIGTPRKQQQKPTGMYTLFEDHFNKIYGNESDTSDIEALHDNEPAIEALTKFSIWYLSDYWNLGLLPQIKNESELKLEPTKYSEKECSTYRAPAESNLKLLEKTS